MPLHVLFYLFLFSDIKGLFFFQDFHFTSHQSAVLLYTVNDHALKTYFSEDISEVSQTPRAVTLVVPSRDELGDGKHRLVGYSSAETLMIIRIHIVGNQKNQRNVIFTRQKQREVTLVIDTKLQMELVHEKQHLRPTSG